MISLSLSDPASLSKTDKFYINSNGLMGYWTFAEGAGTIAHDSTANSNSGSLINSPLWVAGLQKYALQFDGSSNYLNIGTPISTQISNNFTVCIWINPAANKNHDFFANMWHFQDSGLLLGINANGKLRQFFSNGTTGTSANGSIGSVIPLNQWTHIVYTWASGISNFYINGILDSSFNGSGTVTSIMYNSIYDLIIGRDSGGSDEFFSGSVDSPRIYNRVLSQAEITQIYNFQG